MGENGSANKSTNGGKGREDGDFAERRKRTTKIRDCQQLSKGSSEEDSIFEYEEEDEVENLEDGSLENQTGLI